MTDGKGDKPGALVEIPGIGRFGPGTDGLWQPRQATALAGGAQQEGQRLKLEYRLKLRALSWREFWGGTHFAIRAKLARDWNQTAQLMLRDIYRSRPELEKLRLVRTTITLVAHCRSPLIDADNVCAKPLIDGMKRWVYHRRPVGANAAIAGDERKYRLERSQRPVWLFEDDGNGQVVAYHAESCFAVEDSVLVRVEGDAVPKPAAQQVLNYPRGS